MPPQSDARTEAAAYLADARLMILQAQDILSKAGLVKDGNRYLAPLAHEVRIARERITRPEPTDVP